jgi:uncharacterized paraquat-inducible protein A
MSTDNNDLNRRYAILCAVIKTRTNQIKRLQVELDGLHAEADKLEDQIVKREEGKYCARCSCSLTSTDCEAGRCTQCGCNLEK